jgi:hypothetical protein
VENGLVDHEARITTVEAGGIGSSVNPAQLDSAIQAALPSQVAGYFSTHPTVVGPAAIGNTELANDSVTSSKILDGSVTTAEIADNSVTTAKIPNGAILTAKLDAAITSQLVPAGGTTGQALLKSGSTYTWGNPTAIVSDASIGVVKLASDTLARLFPSGGTASQVVARQADGSLAWVTPTSTPADASSTTKGVLTLGGDLGGTATAPTTPTAVHLTGNESVAGTKTFTGAVVVPTPATSTQAATKGYVDGLASAATLPGATAVGKSVLTSTDASAGRLALGAAAATDLATVTTSLANYGAEPVILPAGAFSPFSATQVSSQVIANVLRSNIVLDKGTTGAAIGVIHAIGVPLPSDWNTFTLEADFQLFGAAIDASTNVARVSVVCVQYDDPGAAPTAPTHSWQNITVPVGVQTSVVATSSTITRTNQKAIIYVARDAQAAVGAGDTFGSRLILTSLKINRVS